MIDSTPDAYAESYTRVLALLAQLQQQIEDMPAPYSDGIDRGHLGSMNYIEAKLLKILTFILF